MAGPVTRRKSLFQQSDREDVTDEAKHKKEMELYTKIAAAIGDSLEAVCNMQDKERNDLISVLGLDVDADKEKDSYVACKEVTEKKLNFIDGNTEENAVDDIDNGKFGSTHVSNSSKDDDIKIVAVKKRKRSASLESSTESKRKELRLVHNSVYVKDYEEIIINDSNDDNNILKDSEMGLDNEESMSLLDQKVRSSESSKTVKDFSKKAALNYAQIEELLDTFSDESKEQTEECKMRKSNDYSVLDDKMSEVNKILLTKAELPKVQLLRLNNLVTRKLVSRNEVLSQTNLPVHSGEVHLNIEPSNENRDLLFKYFGLVEKVQINGLVHGSMDIGNRFRSWNKIVVKNIGKKKELKIKFLKEDILSEDDKDLNVEIEVSNNLLSRNDDMGAVHGHEEFIESTPSKDKFKSIHDVNEKLATDKKVTLNRLRLPKRKNKVNLASPNKACELQSDMLTVLSSPVAHVQLKSVQAEANISDNLLSSPLRKKAKLMEPVLKMRDNTCQTENDGSDDDDNIEIVLEVANDASKSNKNTPIKSNVATPRKQTGLCPLCSKQMNITWLLKHSATCEGPEQGPSLRNTNLRGRR